MDHKYLDWLPTLVALVFRSFHPQLFEALSLPLRLGTAECGMPMAFRPQSTGPFLRSASGNSLITRHGKAEPFRTVLPQSRARSYEMAKAAQHLRWRPHGSL